MELLHWLFQWCTSDFCFVFWLRKVSRIVVRNFRRIWLHFFDETFRCRWRFRTWPRRIFRRIVVSEIPSTSRVRSKKGTLTVSSAGRYIKRSQIFLIFSSRADGVPFRLKFLLRQRYPMQELSRDCELEVDVKPVNWYDECRFLDLEE